MGIADRDYARNPATHRRAGVVPGMPMISVNTWIIIINVVVFVLAGTIFRNPVRMTCGTEWGSNLTEADKQNALVDRETTYRKPDSPWILFNKIYKNPGIGGNTPLSLETGRPVLTEIGRARFADLDPLNAIGHFSTGKAFVEMQVWRFITFQFLHANLTHIIFNMLGLWFVGGLVEEHLGRRRYAAFYLTCGVLGGLCYMLLNLLGYLVSQWFPGTTGNIPFLLVSDPYTPLVGASAGVFGVLLAAAYIAPNSIVEVLFILPMKMRTAVYLFLALAVVNLFRGGNNAGGDAAHVGGALAGYFLVRRTHVLRGILGTFGFNDDRDRSAPWTQRSRSGKAMFKPSAAAKAQIEVDRILEKVTREGIGSLTAAERDTLRDAHERSNDLK